MHGSASADSILKFSAQDVTCDLDLSSDEVTYLLELAGQVKAAPARYADALGGRSLSLLFEKPSLRTRVTFEVAIRQLGGHSVFSNGPIGEREPVKDVARNLDRWTQGIVARVFSQNTILELARWASVPVINALSDLYHPCQALADVMTLREHFGELRGLKVAFVGDGNNVAHSLMLSAVRLGASFAIATPAGFGPNPEIANQAEGLAAASGSSLLITTDPEEAVAGANAVYTDVWTSMGSESEAERRRMAFSKYQVNERLFALAGRDAIFMHCLPAHRGEEVTDEVIESAQSAVFDQAENRLHAQKALLLMVLD
ncbi:MAG: ornithine carbamoyltransferase [Bryobacteraceae bacterium]